MRAVNNRISDTAGKQLDDLSAHFESQRVALETIIRDGFKTYIPQEGKMNSIKIGNIDTVPEHDPYHQGQCTATTTVLFINPTTEYISVGQEMDQGATDADVWHHRIIDRFLSDITDEGILTPDTKPLEQYLNSRNAQTLLHRVVDNYSIDWDGHNMVGQHTDTSAEALNDLITAIEELPHTTYLLWDTGDYLQHGLDMITAKTSDEQLTYIARDSQPENNVILDRDVLEYITEHRNSLRE